MCGVRVVRQLHRVVTACRAEQAAARPAVLAVHRGELLLARARHADPRRAVGQEYARPPPRQLKEHAVLWRGGLQAQPLVLFVVEQTRRVEGAAQARLAPQLAAGWRRRLAQPLHEVLLAVQHNGEVEVRERARLFRTHLLALPLYPLQLCGRKVTRHSQPLACVSRRVGGLEVAEHVVLDGKQQRGHVEDVGRNRNAHEPLIVACNRLQQLCGEMLLGDGVVVLSHVLHELHQYSDDLRREGRVRGDDQGLPSSPHVRILLASRPQEAGEAHSSAAHLCRLARAHGELHMLIVGYLLETLVLHEMEVILHAVPLCLWLGVCCRSCRGVGWGGLGIWCTWRGCSRGRAIVHMCCVFVCTCRHIVRCRAFSCSGCHTQSSQILPGVLSQRIGLHGTLDSERDGLNLLRPRQQTTEWGTGQRV
mmetsp:Transcript_1349/g.4856  ORF Transcript_1349/g.4856 Transcript_1349/m.4856 type:complete len:421 (-) Transcript_1349:15-1277(-)